MPTLRSPFTLLSSRSTVFPSCRFQSPFCAYLAAPVHIAPHEYCTVQSLTFSESTPASCALYSRTKVAHPLPQYLSSPTTSRGARPARESPCACASLNQSPHLALSSETRNNWPPRHWTRHEQQRNRDRHTRQPRAIAIVYNHAPHAALELECRSQYGRYDFARRAHSALISRLWNFRFPTAKTALMAHKTMHARGRKLPDNGM